MAVNLSQPTDVLPIQGVKLASASAGIRYQGRDDLVLIELAEQATVAAVFTNNKFCAAPVTLSRKHLNETSPRYLIINAGNANAGTGQLGMDAAIETSQLVSEQMGVSSNQVLPFSTGVIGEALDVGKIHSKLSELKNSLSEQGWLNSANAIMTTDTVAKAFSQKLIIKGKEIHITGISKGSGMIQPNMATMLAYIATDLAVDKDDLQNILSGCVDKSFNAITIDSDTSTNDSCVLIATAYSQLNYSDLNENEKNKFHDALLIVMQKLAQAIVRDGEGASKFVEVIVETALNTQQAKAVAYSIANSPLVKTALSASDPNWGRIMAAAGKIDDDKLNLSKASLLINNVVVMHHGELDAAYTEDAGQTAMKVDEIKIIIQLNQGGSNHSVWTTDLTHEYVTINADYRS